MDPNTIDSSNPLDDSSYLNNEDHAFDWWSTSNNNNDNDLILLDNDDNSNKHPHQQDAASLLLTTTTRFLKTKEFQRPDYGVLSVCVMTLGLIIMVEVGKHKIDHMARGKRYFTAVLNTFYAERKCLKKCI